MSGTGARIAGCKRTGLTNRRQATREMQVEQYGRGFYRGRDASTRYAAERVLELLTTRLPPINSAVDVGCGVGTWLASLMRRGTEDIQGIEGPWARPELLEIPAAKFHQAEISTLREWPRRFDLAICLEVAEHVDASMAGNFVKLLCDMSDFVLFSAAVPFQGGRHHVNEQWPGYWVERFAERGYRCHDWIRPQIWEEHDIPVWYRQNILVFVSSAREPDLLPGVSAPPMPLAVVHPEMYTMKLEPRPIGSRIANILKRIRER